MAIKLTDLIARVPTEVEKKVKRVRDQNRSVLQEALRTESRLVMRTPQDTEENRLGAQVPVEVSAGYPIALKSVTFPGDLDLIMLLGQYRKILEEALSGTRGMATLREMLLRRPDWVHWVKATDEDLKMITEWANSLLKVLDQHDPLNIVLSVSEDIMGIYRYDTRNVLGDEYIINRASIHLYWGVIGLVAEWMGCSVEDLTVVVLTHELAHAYTQLGADIEGRRWPADVFATAEKGLIEGLAQYYTDRVLRRLERRYGGALKAYEAMLPRQPKPYQTHTSWVQNFSPESVRRAMLEVRRWKEIKLENFAQRLTDAQRELHPKIKQLKSDQQPTLISD